MEPNVGDFQVRSSLSCPVAKNLPARLAIGEYLESLTLSMDASCILVGIPLVRLYCLVVSSVICIAWLRAVIAVEIPVVHMRACELNHNRSGRTELMVSVIWPRPACSK